MTQPLKTPRPRLDVAWMAAVLGSWGVIVCVILAALQWNHIVGYLLAVFVMGTRQHALAVRAHDATHYHVSRNKRFNDLLANLFAAWPIGYSFSGYRRWHFEHHRTVGTDSNPELMMYRIFPKKWSEDARQLKLFVGDLVGLGSFEALVLWHDLMQWRPLRPVWRRVEETFGLVLWPVTAASLIGITFGWRVTIVTALLWYGALFTAFFAVYRLRCYTEHIGTESTHRLTRPPLWQRLVYLPADTWLHWEHHNWPSIPLRHFKHASKELEGLVAKQRPRPGRQTDASTGLQPAASEAIKVLQV
jgi:fatty acid desaturase